MSADPDWSLLRSFLAVAEAGSLSAAARATGISQPSLGRHIRELEAQFGVPLVTRAARGVELTEAGAELLPAAREMREAAARAALAAAGRSETLSGTVRITASRIVAHYVLPDMIAALRAEEPEIEIELVPSDATENLLFREADIALRMYRPTQEDLIAAHVADLPVGLYAAKRYLDRKGRPATVEDLLALDFVGFLTSDLILRTMRSLGVERRREDFGVRCDDQIVYWNLVRAGCGVGGMQRLIADPDPKLERLPLIDLPPLPVWLTAPEALRRTPRIRRVFDFLSQAFKSLPAP
ncbi:LysR family transcriptional regulator [Ostreiculturibacter nitratireducens]|uniref:LysR family transcriptional regulator n=1 Tax=Ostreiculturibacter nitratireducens TaxID=3075226 RepID=UPI0031B607F6